MANYNSSGIDRREEVKSAQYRAPVTSFGDRVKNIFEDANSIRFWSFFGATVIALTSFIPMVAELLFVTGFLTMRFNMNYTKRHWRAPYRIPSFAEVTLKKKYKRSFLDVTKEGKKGGSGDFFLGTEFPDQNGLMSEVWAEANDLKTHRLVIGTTGSGKTEEIMGLFHNALMLDSGMILVDGKADPKTYRQMLSIARVMGREEDFLTLNYLLSGRDVFGPNATKTSNTYNPLAGGTPSQKAELMISLLSGSSSGKSDVWSDRAEAFLQAVMEPLSFLESRGYVLFSPRLLGNYYLLENIENLYHFGILVTDNGETITLNDPTKQSRFRDWQQLKSKFMGQMGQFLDTLPSYAGGKPNRPWPVRSLTAADVAKANIEYLKAVGGSIGTVDKAAKELDEVISKKADPAIVDAKRQALFDAKQKVQDAYFAVLNKRISENDVEADSNDALKALAVKAGEMANSYGIADVQSLGQSRDKVNEQFGYITMQLVRATNDMTFNLGHIYNVELGEINFRDVAFNRRILYVTLPALTRSQSSMEQLGKMAVTAIKSLMGEMLNVPFEGKARNTVDARPSNSHIPLPVVLDEYGYYVVPGFAVAPAQARSYGFSMTFGVQDYSSLLKGSKEEGEATFENTNLRHIGRTTGGEESPTFTAVAGASGNAFFFKDGQLSYERGRVGSSFKRTDSIALESARRLSYNDLAGQENGQFTLIVGTKTGSTRSGDVNVVRYTCYFTGAMPQVENMRLMHYVLVPPTPTSRKSELVKGLEEAKKRQAVLQRWLSIDPGQLYEKVRSRLKDLKATHDEYQEIVKHGSTYLATPLTFKQMEEQALYFKAVINSAQSAKSEDDIHRLCSKHHNDAVLKRNRWVALRAQLKKQATNDEDDIKAWLEAQAFGAQHIYLAMDLVKTLSSKRIQRELHREKQVVTGSASNSATKIMVGLLQK